MPWRRGLKNLGSALRYIRHEQIDAEITMRGNFAANFKTAVALEVLHGDKRVISKSGV
jgi:hypothetical protein